MPPLGRPEAKVGVGSLVIRKLVFVFCLGDINTIHQLEYIYIYITSYTYIDVTCLYIHPQHTQFFFRNPLGFILLKRAPLRFLVHTAAPPLRPEESTCRRWPNTFVKSWLSTSVPSWSPLRRRRRFGVSNAKTVGWSLVGNGKVWGGGMTETGETFPEKTYIDICVNIYIYIYLEPNWPLFLKVNPPKQGPFQAKQGSFGF